MRILHTSETKRGPQSTLFGKNASAGVISIVTKKPQFTFGGNIEASYGNYNAVEVNGITGLALMKADVLQDFDCIKVCTSYTLGGTTLYDLPSSIEDLERVQPSYEVLPGWGKYDPKLVPNLPEILAHTALIEPGGEATLRFAAHNADDFLNHGAQVASRMHGSAANCRSAELQQLT